MLERNNQLAENAAQRHKEILDCLSHPDVEMRIAALQEVASLGEAGALHLGYAKNVARLTQDPDSEVQHYALFALGGMGQAGLEHVDAVVAKVSSSTLAVRQMAFQALGSLGPGVGQKAAAAVEKCLSDPDLGIVGDACRTLGSMKVKEAVPKLKGKLSDQDPHVIVQALNALAALDAEVDAIAAQLFHNAARVREAALNSLGKMSGIEGFAADVAKCVGDENVFVRIAAVNLLSVLSGAAASARCSKEARGLEVAIAVDSPNDLKEVHAKFAQRMEQMGIGQDQIKEKPVVMFTSAGGKSKKISGPEDLENVGLPGQMHFAFQVAKVTDLSTHVPTIVPLLKHADIGVRTMAAMALASVGEAAASEVPILEEMLKETGEDTSTFTLSVAGVQPKVAAGLRKPACAAAAALGAIGAKARKSSVKISMGLKSKDYEVRISCCEALNAMGLECARFESELMDLLEDQHPYVVAAACRALGTSSASSVPSSAVAEAVAECLADRHPAVRSAAAEAMGRMGEECLERLDVLAKKLDDPIATVKVAAMNSIVACGERGQMYAADICRLIYDDIHEARIGALAALQQMGERGAAFAEEITSLLEDAHAEIRSAALKALVAFGCDHAGMFKPEVSKVAKSDPVARIRDEAKAALLAL